MAMWKNDDEMFALMKEKLYTPVVGDDRTMGYKHRVPARFHPPAGCTGAYQPPTSCRRGRRTSA